MKKLVNYIHEKKNIQLTEYINEAKEVEPCLLYFPNLSSYLLFKWEIEGQISDGNWENARPANHWKWLNKAECIIDSGHEPGYEGPKHRIVYDCQWMVKYLRKWTEDGDENYRWCQRFLNFGKAGMILNQNDADKYDDNGEIGMAYRYMIEDLPEEEVTPEEFEASLSDYMRDKYYSKVKSLFTKSFLKKWYKTQYTMRDFKADLADAQEVINTQLDNDYAK